MFAFDAAALPMFCETMLKVGEVETSCHILMCSWVGLYFLYEYLVRFLVESGLDKFCPVLIVLFEFGEHF